MRWGALILFAALPLQWIVLASTPFGPARVHELAIALFAGLVLVRFRARAHHGVARVALGFLVASMFTYVLWGLMAVANHGSPLPALQELAYLTICVVLATFFRWTAAGGHPRALAVLRWSAAAATVVLLVALSASMLANGSNPAAVLGRTISTGDPDLMMRELFKTGFTGYGFDEDTVRANLRHEIFAAVLLSMYVSAWARHLCPFDSRVAAAAYRLALVLGTCLLLLSMSRSVLIAALAWPLVAAFRALRRQGFGLRQVVAVYGVIGATMLVVVSGVGGLLWARFTENTRSYEAREELYGSTFARIQENFFTGGVSTAGASSHNFVLDAWLRGGVLVAACAAAVLVILFWTWGKWLARLPAERVWMVPVVAAFALPVSRMLTAGGGLISPVGWVTLAFVLGAIAGRHRLRDSLTGQASTPAAPVTPQRVTS